MTSEARSSAATRREKNRQYQQAYLARHPEAAERARQRARDRYWAKHEELKAQAAAYRKAHPERHRAAVRAWVERNGEHIGRYNTVYRAAHPEIYAEAEAWARIARSGRHVKWADRAAIRAIYEEAARLTRETGIPHEVDHRLPLRGKFVSGLHVHQNLRVVTRHANRTKFNRFEEHA